MVELGRNDQGIEPFGMSDPTITKIGGRPIGTGYCQQNPILATMSFRPVIEDLQRAALTGGVVVE